MVSFAKDTRGNKKSEMSNICYDYGYVGGKEEGKIGKGSEEKVSIVVAVEEKITGKGRKTGYTAYKIGTKSIWKIH